MNINTCGFATSQGGLKSPPLCVQLCKVLCRHLARVVDVEARRDELQQLVEHLVQVAPLLLLLLPVGPVRLAPFLLSADTVVVERITRGFYDVPFERRSPTLQLLNAFKVGFFYGCVLDALKFGG